MISKKMEEQLNEQIKHELYSAHYYFAISAHCSAQNLDGAAHFFKRQSEEEVEHAMKIYHFLFEVDSRAVVPALEQPPIEYASLEDIFLKALEHEKFITGRIHKLVTLANEEKDYATANMLQWFVEEQVEEENTMSTLLAQIKMVGTDSRGLFLIDRELAKRE